ncbi:MAG: hypothetical protein ALAOOOJD_01905 [bacterium]|nr:hypothetical protein [bacterium]
MRKFPKVVELYCHERTSKQQMTRKGYSDDHAMVLFQCHGCGLIHAFPVATMICDGIVPPPKIKKTEVAIVAVAPLEYSPSDVYQVGQSIHHAAFDDIGKIISENTLHGHGKIVVAFEKSGKKILIHGLPRR